MNSKQTTLFYILTGLIDQYGIDKVAEHLTHENVDDYALNGCDTALSETEINKIITVGKKWAKQVSSGNGEWGLLRQKAKEELS